jgi:hypothetical protein
MQNGIFPKFDTHKAVHCFHCNDHIGNPAIAGYEYPINYGFPRGAFGVWCDRCKLRTYYDTPDKSIKFDKKGDRIEPACLCGCIVDYSQWKTNESGWKECPDCQMV